MTLVVNNKIDVPGTHVLIVGVGHYPHFPGYRVGVNMLGQIDSAERGAQHVAIWFRDEFHNPERPLATMRFLLSNDQKNTWYLDNNAQLDAATVQNFKSAYDGWMADAKAQPGSTLVFYFSGHGIASLVQQSLILEDFNLRPTGAMDGAISYANLEQSVQTQSNASHAWFFVDSCRTADIEHVAGQHFGQPVSTSTAPLAKPGGPRIFTINSTLPGHSAIGKKGTPSVFSQALVNAFRTNAYTDRAGRRWACVPDVIGVAISGQIARLQTLIGLTSADCPQPTMSMHETRTPLHYLPDGRKPRMLVDISCDPEGDNASHTIYWKQSGTQVIQAPIGQIWKTELEPGHYDFGALDRAGLDCKPYSTSIYSPYHSISLI